MLQVVRDELGLAPHIIPGRPFSTLLDRESFGKALNFFVELRSHGAAFDWQLNVPLAGQIIPLNFAGAVLDQTLLILAAKTRHDVMQLYDDLLRMNNEQTNALRMALKDHNSPSSPDASRETSVYDELTKVYNELANAQREVAKQNSELERLNTQKNRFLGMAAHDLRNPLSAILMYSDFLIDDVAHVLNEEQREFLTIIRSSSEFMLHLVEDFLDVATIESGKLHMNLEPVDPVALIRKNLLVNRALAAKKQILLDFVPPGVCPALMLDAPKIEQVLQNVLSNAIKFSPSQTTVTIVLTTSEQHVQIAVSDQGPGIPPQEQHSLFEPFERTSVKSTNGEKSSGLGLAIAQKIVAAHGGQIWAENNPDIGSTFYIVLPC